MGYTHDRKWNDEKIREAIFKVMDYFVKRFIIPTTVLKGQTQLCVGKNSKYDKYDNAWKYLKEYDAFYKGIAQETR